MESSGKLFLLDAYALIYRAHYAMARNPMFSDSGFNTSIVFGFVHALDDVLNKEHPTHVAVVFDPAGPTFRHRFYPAYKANRPPSPPEIKESVPVIKEILEAYRIQVLQIDDYEADDVIGTLSCKAAAAGLDVYMMTPDKDYVQLVRDHVYLYKPRHSGSAVEIWDAASACAHYELDRPLQMIDYLALMGDASDNVPGARGVGPKTAIKLLRMYNSVEGLLEHVEELTGSIKEKILTSRDNILLSKMLVTINTEVPVTFDCSCCRLLEPDYNRLAALFRKYSFRSLSAQLAQRRAAAGQQQTSGTTEDIHLPETYHLLETDEACRQLLELLKDAESVCFQIDASSPDLFPASCSGLVFVTDPREAWYVTLAGEDEQVAARLSVFAPVFENPGIRKIGYELKRHIKWLHHYGVQVCGHLFDVSVAHYLLQPERRHDLFLLASEYLQYNPEYNDYNLKNTSLSSIFDMDTSTEKVTKATEAAAVTMSLVQPLESALQQVDMVTLCREVEMPLIHVLADMEEAGVTFSKDSMKSFSEQLLREETALQEEIFQWAGIRFNLSSPKQLGEVLFDRLQLADPVKKTRTKQFSTDEEVLLQLAENHPMVNKILEYRSLRKLRTTYAEALPNLISPLTGKLHTTFNQTVTATGRLSSTDPNLQNIPVREERGREMRNAFVPSGPEYTLLSADYSQIELRLMAAVSGDEAMIEAFSRGEDIHAMTASRIHHVPLEAVTREMRSKAKTANFGIIYGISAFGLAQRMHIPRTEAAAFIEAYFQAFPDIRRYMHEAVSEAESQGFVTTLMGRRRYLPDIRSSNANVRSMAARNAVNAPIQGTAADIIKSAMVRIHRIMQERHLKSRMILQVHDELVFDVFIPELAEVTALVKEAMEHAMQLPVPLTVSAASGASWLEAHE